MLKFLEQKRGLALSVTFVIAITIFLISSREFGGGYSAFSWLPVAYHFFAFFFLNLFLSISLVQGKFRELFPIAIVMSILYGITDEIHQFFVPGRAMSVGDIFIDSAGIVTAGIVYFFVIAMRKNN